VAFPILTGAGILAEAFNRHHVVALTPPPNSVRAAFTSSSWLVGVACGAASHPARSVVGLGMAHLRSSVGLNLLDHGDNLLQPESDRAVWQ
jgi:hypothetical protein